MVSNRKGTIMTEREKQLTKKLEDAKELIRELMGYEGVEGSYNRETYLKIAEVLGKCVNCGKELHENPTGPKNDTDVHSYLGYGPYCGTCYEYFPLRKLDVNQ
jgi:hypothetical protein